MPVVRAKFRCDAKTERSYSKNADGTPIIQKDIELNPVMGGSEENKAFWKASPSGKITLGCANLPAADLFEIGKEYYIDFTPAEA